MKKDQIQEGLKKHWLKLTGMLFLVFLLLQKDLSLHLDLNNAHLFESRAVFAKNTAPATAHATMNIATGLMNAMQPTEKAIPTTTQNGTDNNDANWGNTYSNMTYHDPKEPATKRLSKRRRQEAYIKRFAATAQSEMKKYGIPASIKLAQGLIESNAGDSRLSKNNNNHFGMKCFSKKCAKNHCSNFTDDSHKDFFRKYETAWESFRAHSQLLRGSKRYANLFKLSSKDYEAWAKGLKKAGYATDKRYAEKLIYIIKDLNLHQYDS